MFSVSFGPNLNFGLDLASDQAEQKNQNKVS
jgi:hypothetical protein